MCRLRNIAMRDWLPRKCDYRTDSQTHTHTHTHRWTDRRRTKVIPMCRYASQVTQKVNTLENILEKIFHRTKLISVWWWKIIENFSIGYFNINLFFSCIFFDKFHLHTKTPHNSHCHLSHCTLVLRLLVYSISIGQFNAHTAGHDFFLPCRNLTKACPFATRYLSVLARSLHISYFLPFGRRSSESVFFCLVVFQGLPPSTYFNFTRKDIWS